MEDPANESSGCGHCPSRCLPLNSFKNTQFKSFVNTGFKPTMYSPHRAMFEVAGQNRLVGQTMAAALITST